MYNKMAAPAADIDETPTGIVYFDLETTGVDVEKDRIVSVAASCRDARFYSTVNPTVPIPAGASRVHKLFDKDVAGSPTWAAVAPLFFEFVSKHGGKRPVLVAYNGARFDNPLLVIETRRAEAGAVVSRLMDSLFSCDAYVIAREKLPRLPSKSLSNLYKHFFAEDMPGAHTADGDTAALVRICEHESIAKHMGAYVQAFAMEKFTNSCTAL
jgi:DNA polymerase-3 subunit epsilon